MNEQLFAIIGYTIRNKKIPILISIGLFLIVFFVFYFGYKNEISLYPAWTNSADPSITIYSFLIPLFIAFALLRSEWKHSLEKKLIVHFVLKKEERKEFIMSFYNASLLENADIRTIGQQFGRQIADKQLDFNPAIKPQKEDIIKIIDENGKKKWIKYFEVVFLLDTDPFENDVKKTEFKDKYVVSNLMFDGPKKKILGIRPEIAFDQSYSKSISLSDLLSTDIVSKSKFEKIIERNEVPLEITKIDLLTQKITKIYILNSSVITSEGQFSYQKIDLDTAKVILKKKLPIEMAIGYESTATLISELFYIEATKNRTSIMMQTNEAAIVIKTKKRLEENKVLTINELEEIGYELGWMAKIS